MQEPYEITGKPIDFSNCPFCKDVPWYQINPRIYYPMPILTYFTPYVTRNPDDRVYQMMMEYLQPKFCYGFSTDRIAPGPFHDITGTVVFVDARDNSVPYIDEVNVANPRLIATDDPWLKYGVHKYDNQSWFIQVRDAIILANQYHKWISGLIPKKSYPEEALESACWINNNDIDRTDIYIADDGSDLVRKEIKRLYGGCARITRIDFMEFSWFLKTTVEDREWRQRYKIQCLEKELSKAREAYMINLNRDRLLF